MLYKYHSVLRFSRLHQKIGIIFVAFVSLSIASTVLAAPSDAYWVAGTGNWSDAANHWATSSGGSPGAGNLPDSTSIVHFDSSSGSGTATVDSDVAVAGFINATSLTTSN